MRRQRGGGAARRMWRASILVGLVSGAAGAGLAHAEESAAPAAAASAAAAPASAAASAARTRWGVQAFAGSGSTTWDIDGFRTIEGSYDGDASPRGLGLWIDKPGRGIFRYVSVISYEEWGDETLNGGPNGATARLKTDYGIVSDHQFDFDLVRGPRFRLSLGPGVVAEVLHGGLDGWRAAGSTFEIAAEQSYTRLDLGAGGQITAGFALGSALEMTLTASYRYSASVYEDFGAGPIDDASVTSSVLVVRAGFLFGATGR